MWIFKMISSPLSLYIMVFAVTRVLATWQQRGDDIIAETITSGSPGFPVSSNSDGTIVVIGVHTNDNRRGHVRVWEYDEGNWTQRGDDIDGEHEGDASGDSVALSKDGNVVAIGALYNDEAGNNAGHTRIFEYDEYSWQQRGRDIDGEASGDLSGTSVALSDNGDVVAIGALGNDGGGTNAGHVRVYEFISDQWSQRGADIDGEASVDGSGAAVSLNSDGNVVAIGAISNDDGGKRAGHVRVYEFVADGNATRWKQRGDDIDGEAAGDDSGTSVSLSSNGNIVAIGAPYNDGNGVSRGHVRVFEYHLGTWDQRGSDIDGKSDSEEIGESVSLNSDGNEVAFGSGYENAQGFARVYSYNGSEWQQRGDDLANGRYRHTVSLSSDGNVVTVGRPADGIARVFEYPVTSNPTSYPSAKPSEYPTKYPSMAPSTSPSAKPPKHPSRYSSSSKDRKSSSDDSDSSESMSYSKSASSDSKRIK
eukprot:282691_1